MPVNLALTTSRKSSMLSTGVLKGERTTLVGSGTRIDGRDLQCHQERISGGPPLPLSLTSLRAKVNGGSRSVSPNSSVTGGPTEIAQSGNNRSSPRVEDTERRLSRTSSDFSFQGGELDVDEQSSDVSSSFPTFANNCQPVDPKKGVAATIDDLQEGGEVRAQPVCRAQADVFQTGVVDIVKEDMLRPSSSRTDHDEVISMHRVELFTNESGTLVEEVREKIDLKSTLEVGGGIQANKRGTVENNLDEEVDHLQTHGMSPKNTPTSMVFSINGEFATTLCMKKTFSDFSRLPV
jgi:hypothetical protein